MLSFGSLGLLLSSLATLATAAQTAHGQTPAQLAAMAFDNELFAHYILILLAAVVVAAGIYRIVILSVQYIRTLTCLNNDTQRYFREPNYTFGIFKQHLIYAPLFRKRHNRDLRIFRSSFGVIPSRMQSLFLVGIIAMNIIFCVYKIEWHGTQQALLSHFRNRTGILAVVNMIPLVIMAGRNNPLIGLLNISYDHFNLVHRWFGRIVVVESIAHVAAFSIYMVNKAGWAAYRHSINESKMLTAGVVGTIAFVAILLQACKPLRSACYEIFLHLHIALIITALVGLWIHLDGLPSRRYLDIVLVAWALERLVRLITLAYRNLGHGGTKATLEALPGSATRVTLQLARPFHFTPGQNIFLTIPSLGLWTSHPFSIAWCEETASSMDTEKGLLPSPFAPRGQTISLIVRSRKGFTSKLHSKALASPSLTTLTALVEGPYPSTSSLSSYGTLLLIAGGVGITHILPFLPALINGFADSTVATRRISLVWVIQSPEHLEWIRPFMTSILSLPRRRDILRISLFVTRPRSTKEIKSPSETVRMFPGRPNVDTVVGRECEDAVGAMGVVCCGPGGLGDEVRSAVRRRQGEGNLDFLEEGFGW